MKDKNKIPIRLLVCIALFVIFLFFGIFFSAVGSNGIMATVFLVLGFIDVIFTATFLAQFLKEREEAKEAAPGNIIVKDYKSKFRSGLFERLEVQVVEVEATTRDRSIILSPETGGKIPVLLLYTLGESYDTLVGNRTLNLLKEDLRDVVLNLWKNALSEYNMSLYDYYDEEMEISVVRYEEKCYADYARVSEDGIRKYIYSKIHKYPLSITTTADPAIVITVSLEDYDVLYTKEIRDDIIRYVKERAVNYVEGKYKMRMDCILSVEFVSK